MACPALVAPGIVGPASEVWTDSVASGPDTRASACGPWVSREPPVEHDVSALGCASLGAGDGDGDGVGGVGQAGDGATDVPLGALGIVVDRGLEDAVDVDLGLAHLRTGSGGPADGGAAEGEPRAGAGEPRDGVGLPQGFGGGGVSPGGRGDRGVDDLGADLGGVQDDIGSGAGQGTLLAGHDNPQPVGAALETLDGPGYPPVVGGCPVVDLCLADTVDVNRGPALGGSGCGKPGDLGAREAVAERGALAVLDQVRPAEGLGGLDRAPAVAGGRTGLLLVGGRAEGLRAGDGPAGGVGDAVHGQGVALARQQRPGGCHRDDPGGVICAGDRCTACGGTAECHGGRCSGGRLEAD